MIFNRLNRIFCGIASLAFASISTGQSAIDAEQPFAAHSAGTVPWGSTQIEAGGWLQWETPDGEEAETFSYAVPTGVIRYGFRERLEVRVGARFSKSLGEAEEARGGIKWNIVPNADRFRVAWVSELEANLNRITSSTRVPSRHRICAEWTDANRWSARANWGVRWGADSTEMIIAGAVARQVGWQGWTVFVEPMWQTIGGIRLHAGGILNVDEIAQVSVGIEQSLKNDAFRFTLGYCRRILPTPTFP
jgi:hypothetical protein